MNSANMFMIRAPFPRAIGTDFSGVLESIGSTEGRVPRKHRLRRRRIEHGC
jgi:hypothetical protein